MELLIAQGVLVKALDASFVSDQRFFVVWPHAVALSPEAIRVRDWLASQAPVDVEG